MIAEKIWRGETAWQIGIPAEKYQSRKELVDRFCSEISVITEFQEQYKEWIKSQPEGDIGGVNILLPQKSSGRGDSYAKMTSKLGIKPCGGCKKRRKSQNEKHPYDGNEGIVDKFFQAVEKIL